MLILGVCLRLRVTKVYVSKFFPSVIAFSFLKIILQESMLCTLRLESGSGKNVYLHVARELVYEHV